MEDSEREPLIIAGTSNSLPPPPAYSAVGYDSLAVQAAGSGTEFLADELPPPYMPSGHGSIPMINCKVCQAMINLEGKMSQHVVKCGVCNEATAIRPAPAGKKYVRCKCNCLLICKASSRRVVCPRETCKKLIVLGPPANEIAAATNIDTPRVVCVHCQQTFFFSVYHNALARCPHCRRVSSVGNSFARNRSFLFLIPGLLLMIAVIIVIATTRETRHFHSGIYAAYVVMLVLSLLMLLRAFYYCTIKVSRIDGPVA